jgi:hypothetical protein
MRYLVKAILKSNKAKALKNAIEKKLLGKGSVAGLEYIRDMQHARIDDNDNIWWVEVCFCDPPLAEERPYWEEYFELLDITDAANRLKCKHETGENRWSCVNCACARQTEADLCLIGKSFLWDFL